MKKILISILILFSAGLFAEEIPHEEEFTWAKYEMMCYMNGVEPSYEEYSFLLENPTDFDDEESLKKIIMEIE